MFKLVQNILFAYGLLLSVSALAETVVISRAANIWSSSAFYGRGNVLDQLPKGAQVEVLSRRTLGSGAEALEIKIISPADKVSLNEQKSIYIWQSKTEVKNKAFTEAGVPACLNCIDNPSGISSATNDIKNITNKIEEQESLVQDSPEKEPFASSLEGVPETAECPAIDKINAYSQSLQVAKSIQWAKDHRHKKSDGYCYRHTKEILATQLKNHKGPGNNLIPKWYATARPASASKGATELLDYGFKNLLKCQQYKDQIISNSKVNLDKIPSGAVLVYSRSGGDGHIEFKFTDPEDGKTKYSYWPIFSYPIIQSALGNKYKLIGVMVKP